MQFLGRKGRDVISGFAGVITGHATYITGCDQLLVSPSMTKDGAVPEAQWIDRQRIQLEPGEPITLDNGATPGPGKPAPKR